MLVHLFSNAFFYSKLGFKAAVEAWSESADLDGLVGPSCSVVCQPVGLLAASWNIPMVSFFCTSGPLSDKETYPTFTRTSPSMVALLPGAYAATIDAFGWVVWHALPILWSCYLSTCPNGCTMISDMIFVVVYLHTWSAFSITTVDSASSFLHLHMTCPPERSLNITSDSSTF